MSSPISRFGVAAVLAAAIAGAAPALAVQGTPEGDPLALARTAFTAYVAGDIQRALANYRAAADLGHVGALWKVARIYENGEIGQPRPHEAYKAYAELAKRHGDISPQARDAVFVANAFVALGSMLANGVGGAVPANRAAAASAYFHAASYFGDTEGQFRLGRMLTVDGADDPDVFRRGVRWLKLAADERHPGAIAMLGGILFDGRHVNQNEVLGLSMLTMARRLAASDRRTWIDKMQQRAYEAASEDVRRTATALAKTELNGSAQ